MTHEQKTNQQHSAINLGEILRQHRQKKKLSIGEVSERLKLPARQIEALENGTYENLPEPVFVRGFLRSYGRFLGLDEAILDEALSHISPPDQVHKVSGNADFNFTKQQNKKSFPTWIIGIFAIVGIAYGVYEWQNKSQAEHAKQEQNTTLSDSNASTVAAPAINNSNVIIKPMTASDTQTATASAASTVSTPASRMGELIIRTRYRTMLTVTDTQGQVLINKIVPAHSEHRFTEGAPFEVRLGYAVGSTATFNGNDIDLEAARQGGKTAVFTTP